jgi:hypothetical protein
MTERMPMTSRTHLASSTMQPSASRAFSISQEITREAGRKRERV